MRRLLALLVILALVGAALYLWAPWTGSYRKPKEAIASVKDSLFEAKTTGAVKTALELNSTLAPYSIKVHTVEDGVVVLKGEVPREEIRMAAENVAAAVPDVRRVKNELRINPNLPVAHDGSRTLGENLDDKALVAKIHTAFSLNRQLKGSDLSVSVFRKAVTLRGEVNDETQHRVALEVARQTAGVSDVSDEIRIKGKAAPAVSGSGAEGVKRALEANPNLAAYDIKVAEEDGKIVLTGRVKSGAEKDLAALVAKDAAGGPVTNSLEVRP
jgi:osmotically-inducible protein OsmY